MTRALILALIAAWSLPGLELPTAPHQLLMPLHPSGFEKAGKRKPPRKKEDKRKPPGEKEEKRKRPVTLSRCLDSCAAGGVVFINFCNDIENPSTRAVCFSKSNESEQQCRGFCSNYFGR